MIRREEGREGRTGGGRGEGKDWRAILGERLSLRGEGGLGGGEEGKVWGRN